MDARPSTPIDAREMPRRSVQPPGCPEIAYVEAGSGPDLILLHGTITALEDPWIALAQTLTPSHHVVAIDRPGHGRSGSARLVDASVWRQAEIVRDVARALRLHKPLVIGHSYGGAVALAYGMAYPEETAGIAALAPICLPEPRLEHLIFGPRALPLVGDYLSEVLRSSDAALLPILWRSMFLPQAMPPRFANEFPFRLAARADRLVTDGESANALWSDLTRSAMGYCSCRVPVHILCGSTDAVVSPIHGSTGAVLIPRARFTLLPGIGHMLHHIRPDLVAAAALSL